MSINTSQRAGWPTELSASMTGSTVLIGTLTSNPVIIIFDNQGSESVSIYVNGTGSNNLWRTFAPNSALVLDLRDKAHLASNFTTDIGTTFYGNGSSGTFSISYIYALTT